MCTEFNSRNGIPVLLVPIYPLLSAAVSLLIAGVGVYYRDCTGSRSLVFLMVAIAWWSVMSVIELGATDLATKRLALKLMYPAIGAVPVACSCSPSSTRVRLAFRPAKSWRAYSSGLS